MIKMTGKSDGINWVWYYELELENNVCTVVRSYRLHKFDDYQGADKHPTNTVRVSFCDATRCSGYGHLNTHIYFEDEGKLYPMFADLTAKADELAAMRARQREGDKKDFGRSIAQQVTKQIENAVKWEGRGFGADRSGTVY